MARIRPQRMLSGNAVSIYDILRMFPFDHQYHLKNVLGWGTHPAVLGTALSLHLRDSTAQHGAALLTQSWKHDGLQQDKA